MYQNPHLRNYLLPSLQQIKKYFRLANTTDADSRDVRPLMSLLQRLAQADLYFFGLIQTRKLAVTGYDFEIVFPDHYTPTPQEEQILQDQRERFHQTRADRLLTIAMNGIIYGISGARLVWENEPKQRQARLAKIKPYDLTELDIADDSDFYFLDSADNGLVKREALTGDENMLVYSNPFYGTVNNYMGGVARVVALLVVLKYLSRHDWSRFNEKYGLPFMYGQYDSRTATKEDVNALLAGMEKLGSDGFGAIPDNIKMLLLEATKNGTVATFLDFIKTVNTEVAIGILGQNLTSEISDKGSRASAEVHDKVRHDILFADLLEVQQQITHSYLRSDFELNYGQPRQYYPEFRFKTDEMPDFEANARILAEVKSANPDIMFKRAEVYSKLGFTEPAGNEDDSKLF